MLGKKPRQSSLCETSSEVRGLARRIASVRATVSHILLVEPARASPRTRDEVLSNRSDVLRQVRPWVKGID